ncbi:MAG: GNAT family N-acetyltransferase [Proteobacteria bacterium]|nr:GNAT family N-acetyltransferase [Pseudomonadota bacterium]
MQVHAVNVDWSTYQDRLRAVRTRVFIEEQGVPTAIEWDGLDEDAHHFIALNEAGQPLGTARLLNSGQIGRMAVLKDQRGRGIGRALLEAAVHHAADSGMSRVFLHAQVHAQEFYRKAGFLLTGTAMVEAGIPHVEMAMMLPIPFNASTAAHAHPAINPGNPPSEVPAKAIVPFDSELECRTAVAELIESARRTVIILSATLDPGVFAAEQILSAISALARRSRSAHVRILVEDTKAIASDNHPLLQLARRLPSKVAMRRLPNDPSPPRTSFVVVDGIAIWVQPDKDVYVGWWNLNDRVEARRLADQFVWLYERSSDDPELRLLSL